MTTCTYKTLGSKVGTVIEVAPNENGEMLGKFLRVRVRMDVEQPLCRGTKLMLQSGETELIEFCYEKLQSFVMVVEGLAIFCLIVRKFLKLKRNSVISLMVIFLRQKRGKTSLTRLVGVVQQIRIRRKTLERAKSAREPSESSGTESPVIVPIRQKAWRYMMGRHTLLVQRKKLVGYTGMWT